MYMRHKSPFFGKNLWYDEFYRIESGFEESWYEEWCHMFFNCNDPPDAFYNSRPQISKIFAAPFFSTVFANIPYRFIGDIRKDRRLFLGSLVVPNHNALKRRVLSKFFYFPAGFWYRPRGPPPSLKFDASPTNFKFWRSWPWMSMTKSGICT